MTGQELIALFEQQVDDLTELSASSELVLLNKVYNNVWNDRPWEFAKKGFSGSINGVSIALPSDFAYIIENAGYTDVSQNNVNGNQAGKIVWVGSAYYILVNWSDRKQYENKSGYCWVDIANSLLVFTTSVSGTITYDYIYFPADLTTATSPVFPEAFHHILYHLMATEDYVIQQSDKAKSYAGENKAQAENWLSKLRYWNANLLNN
jgi:hypothetical protein